MTYKELVKIVNKAKEGNDTAFAKLYSHFADSVYYLALRIVKSKEDAHDVVQETFIKLYKSMDTINDPVTITKFINKIAYHTSLNYIRDKNKDLLMEDANHDMNIPEIEEDFIPEEYMKQKERRDEVVQVLDSLNESQRSVITLFYFQNLSISEIAEIMDVSEQAVKNRLLRARNNMKEKLLLERLGGVLIAMTSATVLAKILALDAGASDFSTINNNIWENIGKNVGFPPQKIASLSKTALAPAMQATSLIPAQQIATSFALGAGVQKAVVGIFVAASLGTGIWAGTNAIPTTTPASSVAQSSLNEITQGNLKPLRYPLGSVYSRNMV